jgi:C1A family cysteine protease
MFSVKPPQKAFDDARKHTQFSYSIVPQDFDAICAAIASGHPVMFGIVVYPSFVKCGLDGRTGIVPIPHSSERPIGGHSLLAVEYDAENETIGFVNHWGNWGDNGFGTISKDYITNRNLAADFCAIESFH